MSVGSAKSWSSVSESMSSAWPPPYIRATIKCSGPTEEAERDLILYPDNPREPTYYSGYADVGYAYASVQFQLGPATSIITPHIVSLYGQDTGWYAVNGDAYQIPNTAFAFFNTNWKYQTPTDAEIRLILAYPGAAITTAAAASAIGKLVEFERSSLWSSVSESASGSTSGSGDPGTGVCWFTWYEEGQYWAITRAECSSGYYCAPPDRPGYYDFEQVWTWCE